MWGDKTKSIIFGTEHKLAKVSSFDVRYSIIHIKHYHTVTYREFSLDKNLSVEIMAPQRLIKLIVESRFCI